MFVGPRNFFMICGGFLLKYFFYLKIYFYFCYSLKQKTMFENHFKAEMKRLNLKRYDVCFLLNCTMPTLKSRLQNPESFTIAEVMILQNADFNLSQFELKIND